MSYTTAAFLKDGELYHGCAQLSRERRGFPWMGFVLKNGNYVKTLGDFKTVPDVWDAVCLYLDIPNQTGTPKVEGEGVDGPLGKDDQP
jgi:hypothetical protein